jgi:signal transduction histidine kinase
MQLNAGKNHQIIFTHQGELERGVWDEKLLWHIITNLLNNAIKYSPNGGIINFDLIDKNTEIYIQIKDQGIGISQENKQRLFEAFYRADNVANIPGTGLGLAIVQKCVEAHDGKILVESQEGVGSCFTIILPIKEDTL